jgi:hypothetical protein
LYPRGVFNFFEAFYANEIGNKWILSKAIRSTVNNTLVPYGGRWSIEPCLDSVEEMYPDLGLVLKSESKYHAISSKLDQIFKFSNNKPLVVQ